MGFLTLVEVVLIGMGMGFLMILFYIKSIKFFQPSEIIAVPAFKKNTGNIDEEANPIYSYFHYQKGGRIFIPFYKNYFVLPTHLITSHIRTQKFLTLDQIYIKVNFVIQYHIDVDSQEKITRAFELFEEFVQDKNSHKKSSNNRQRFTANVEYLFRGIIPEVLGKMKVDALMENRDRANENVLRCIREEFNENGLRISGLKIEHIEIKNRAYLKKLKEITQEKQAIELIKEHTKIQNEKVSLKEEKQKIEKNREEEKFLKAAAKIAFHTKIEQTKIAQNLILMQSHKDQEQYYKSKILTKKRAEKEAKIVLKKSDLEILKIENQQKKLEQEALALQKKRTKKEPIPKPKPKTTTEKIKDSLTIDKAQALKRVKNFTNIFSKKSKKR